jgi:phosphoribosylformylglycinamidine cyclo-ligase
VDLDLANQAKKKIKHLAKTTFNRGVLSEIGSFGGLFRLSGIKDPVLVSSIDGVGTKIKVAIDAGVHNTVGYDLVSHCVNDILVQGAQPLFFLDYFAMGKLEPDVVVSVIEGMALACRENDCVLIGGETAEMPDFYKAGDYDLAGCIVGAVNRARLVNGSRIRKGDVVFGLESAGLHTNGYSLARKILFERLGLRSGSRVPELGMTVAEALLQRHRSYFRDLYPLVERRLLHGMAHITGGGITENVPRVMPKGLTVRISNYSWRPQPIFAFLQRHGNIHEEEMYRTFNMGVGMIVITGKKDGPAVERFWKRRKTGFARIGEVVASRRGEVIYG